ncbi:MAG: hypothetical protein AAGF26_14475, partial [Cyanobacteria bacterium P01_G01_bin.49]
PNISVYLTEEQQQKLDLLAQRGLAQDLLANTAIKTERSRSSLIALLIEQETNKLEEAEMIADAVEIDNCQLGWSEEEQECQIIDMEQFGQ